MKKFSLLLLGLGLIIVAGCEKFERPSGAYIAKVNNSVISEDDFLKEISLIPEWARKNFRDTFLLMKRARTKQPVNLSGEPSTNLVYP